MIPYICRESVISDSQRVVTVAMDVHWYGSQSCGQREQRINNEQCFEGPKFLWSEESMWPNKPSSFQLRVCRDNPQLKREAQAHAVGHGVNEPFNIMINRYSFGYHLKKGVAWLLRFKGYLKRKRQCIPRNVKDNNNRLSSHKLTI